MKEKLETIKYDAKSGCVIIIDQTLLPGAKKYITLRKPQDFYEAIQKLRVRGAPAIGIAAAFGLYLGLMDIDPAATFKTFTSEAERIAAYLNSSRPTAVNLAWALKRMLAKLSLGEELDIEGNLLALKNEAIAIAEEDAKMCDSIGRYASELITENCGILTHCNAGSLATGGIGTATAGMYVAHEKGLDFRVYCDETRPLLQGARLTALELSHAGIDTTLICDNMASSLMGEGLIDIVFTGADRIAANGDTANKIGTRSVAVNAAYHGIPFYICAPYSTIDLDCPSGKDIPIEERSPSEVSSLWYAEPMAPEGISVRNPAFDVTPAKLITGIITERGIFKPPYEESLLFAR